MASLGEGEFTKDSDVHMFTMMMILHGNLKRRLLIYSVYNELSVLELSSLDNPKQRKCVLEELFNFHHEVGSLQTLEGD